MQPIEFWFSIGSTYSYLTVSRLPAIEAERGLSVRWRPFDVRAMMIEQNNIPFKDKPAKSTYMWRDIERRAAKYGVPVAVPAPYPLANLTLANEVALLGMREGWGKRYVTETYRLWFVEGQPAGEDPNLVASLACAGQDKAAVLRRMVEQDIPAALQAETQAATGAGLFGVPSFSVGGEIFWGDDRLDDAISWAKHGRVV